MSYLKQTIAAGFAALLMTTTAFAGDSASDIKKRLGVGDPNAGKEKAAACAGCHGENGESSAPNFPKLAGQYAEYLSRQIFDFQNSKRSDPMMTGMAQGIAERQDVFDIAAYFASKKQMTGEKQPKVNEAGKKLYVEGNSSNLIYGCVNCHGVDGKGMAPDNSFFPVIGGQNKDYLIKTLTDMKKGERNNDPSGMMRNIAKGLSDADIEALADYLSGL